MSSRAADVPETPSVLCRYCPHCSLRQGHNITTKSDDEVWCGWWDDVLLKILCRLRQRCLCLG
jgi:hypothetical protein